MPPSIPVQFKNLQKSVHVGEGGGGLEEAEEEAEPEEVPSKRN